VVDTNWVMSLPRPNISETCASRGGTYPVWINYQDENSYIRYVHMCVGIRGQTRLIAIIVYTHYTYCPRVFNFRNETENSLPVQGAEPSSRPCRFQRTAEKSSLCGHRTKGPSSLYSPHWTLPGEWMRRHFFSRRMKRGLRSTRIGIGKTGRLSRNSTFWRRQYRKRMRRWIDDVWWC
jgi:hypothetical protein